MQISSVYLKWTRIFNNFFFKEKKILKYWTINVWEKHKENRWWRLGSVLFLRCRVHKKKEEEEKSFCHEICTRISTQALCWIRIPSSRFKMKRREYSCDGYERNGADAGAYDGAWASVYIELSYTCTAKDICPYTRVYSCMSVYSVYKSVYIALCKRNKKIQTL